MIKKKTIPVVILAGGLGTRLREETEFRPKPMVMIGEKPILWHIMKLYSHYGFYRFIICLGYKGEMIKDYFLNYGLQDVDVTVNTGTGAIKKHHSNNDHWEITFAHTGLTCMTGGRIARIAKYIDTETFALTYGDGLSDVNIDELLRFHRSHKKLATVTGVNLSNRFGSLLLEKNQVISFLEKKNTNTQWINGGFFIFQRNFLNFLSEDDSCILEQQPLSSVSKKGELLVYKHDSFWSCMDTIRDNEYLNNLWNLGKAPWKVWDDNSLYLHPAMLDRKQKESEMNECR